MRVESEMGGQLRVRFAERRVFGEVLVDQCENVLGRERIGDVLEDRQEQLGVGLAFLLKDGELFCVGFLVKALQQCELILRYERRPAVGFPLFRELLRLQNLRVTA